MPELVTFETRADGRGILTYTESQRDVPFDIKRLFWIRNVPKGVVRGQHAHKKCEQILIACAGSVLIKAGSFEQLLASPIGGLYLGPGERVEMTEFSPDCVLLVLASEYYDPSDYIYD